MSRAALSKVSDYEADGASWKIEASHRFLGNLVVASGRLRFRG